ncbi:MAG: hypothetical protein H0V68_00345 [Actinobacteria bacterium]|nr:hypothetical protein [Actinomycetota bacterium]
MLEDYEGGSDEVQEVFRAGLREIVALRAVLASLEAELVVGARLHGCRWNVLAEDLGLSPGGARKRHLAVDPTPGRKPYRESDLAEVLAELAAPDRT